MMIKNWQIYKIHYYWFMNSNIPNDHISKNEEIINIAQSDITDTILQHYILSTDIDKRWSYKWYPFTIQPRKHLSHYQKEIQSWPSHVLYKRVLDKQGNIKIYNGMQIISIIDREPYMIIVRDHIKEGHKELKISKETLENIKKSSIRYDKKDTFKNRILRELSTYNNKIPKWVQTIISQLLGLFNSE